MEKAFIRHLSDYYLPVWNRLHTEGLVSSINVMRLFPTGSTKLETTPWSFLLIAELEAKSKPKDPFNAEKSLSVQAGNGNTFFAVLRVEHMSCTPDSCYAIPKLSYQDAPSVIDFLIEFIDVIESPQCLTKYRDLMSDCFGPVNGMLVERGFLHCFIALETTEVLFQVDGVPGWNQLHISDYWDEGDVDDWDAVYEELFREEFSCELDSVWNQLPPIRNRYMDYRGRLITDLCIR